MACESFVEHLVGSLYDVVPKIFPYLNVIAHLPVPVGCGSCLPRLAIFFILLYLFYLLFSKICHILAYYYQYNYNHIYRR